jgi:uracil-DNA glycosylase
MPRTLDPELRRALAVRIHYYNEMGIYDFYRRPLAAEVLISLEEEGIDSGQALESGEPMSPRKAAALAMPVVEENIFEVIALKPEQKVSDPVKALKIIREDLGDCTRCALHKQGRKQIVFGVGDPKAELMFVGEGPGADEDIQGEPFVGRAGQLLNNMIKAMGIEREQVYIANIVKCRPPGIASRSVMSVTPARRF